MRERTAAVAGAVADTLYAAPDPLTLTAPVVVTGLGSSQCAARLLAGLLTTHGSGPAQFVPMTDFYRGTHARGGTLVVFSQGLSANARIALARRRDFSKCVLVSSVSEKGLLAAGKLEVLDFLKQLEAEGVCLPRHPLEEEYTLLPRFIGPACALAHAIAMVASISQSRASLPPREVLLAALADAATEAAKALEWVNDFAALPEWNFAGAALEFCGNLQAKVLECLFIRLPQARDLLEFSHGGFQANCHQPAPQWIFCERNSADEELLTKLTPLFSDNPHPLRILRSPLAFPLNLLYYEVYLNRLMLTAVERMGLDLIDWPGKGGDGAGYTLSAPFADSD
jgi:creatinine amidohydrolase